jgi:hypothetical protein
MLYLTGVGLNVYMIFRMTYEELGKYTNSVAIVITTVYFIIIRFTMNLKLQIQVGFRVRIRARCYSLPYLREFRPEIKFHLY